MARWDLIVEEPLLPRGYTQTLQSLQDKTELGAAALSTHTGLFFPLVSDIQGWFTITHFASRHFCKCCLEVSGSIRSA